MSDSNTSGESWQAKAAARRAKRDSGIPPEWKLPATIWDSLELPLETNKNNLIDLEIVKKSGLLTDKELGITEKFNVGALLSLLATGKLSALEVTIAFSKRAAIAQQLTECLTETMFDQAQERARHLDSLQAEGKLAGPLHGLPVSLKDGFQIAGVPATLGMLSFVDHVSDTNSPLVTILLDLGAVLYVKTNIPQTLLTTDSSNNIYGRVLNPWNTALSAGGSSGGEGALVAFRGSPLGVGTDVGGSIRIPATCNGVYGFKPTTSRVPYGGQQTCVHPGLKFVVASAGPISNDFESLEFFVRSVLDKRPATLDSTALDIPWREVSHQDGKKLRFGFLSEDPNFPIHPPVKRTLENVAKALRSEGHEVIVLSPGEGLVTDAVAIAGLLFGLDKTAAGLVQAAGEPFIPSLVAMQQNSARIQMSPNFAKFAHLAQLEGLEKLAALNVERAKILAEWNQLWKKHQIDAVIAPSTRTTAVEHDLMGIPAYTMLLNLLDYPGCVLPYGKVIPSDSSPAMILLKILTNVFSDNAELLQGAPCSVQIFTSKFRDEECLSIAKIVDTCLKRTE
ncbi:amidase signature domain-containing protein [Pestalotiopsis sp. NC0098]|nr:amidase signature domain-containing protein [Pestalotiopsis sp. NC0098]